MTTFSKLAQKSHIRLITLRIYVEGSILPHTDGGWHFEKIKAWLDLTIPKGTHTNQIERLIKLTKKQCIISRAINCPIELESIITYQMEPRLIH